LKKLGIETTKDKIVNAGEVTAAYLKDIKEKDEAGNVVKGRHLTVKTNNSIIQSKDKLIAAVGMENVIIVESEDAILVCNKDNDQDVKELRNLIAEKGMDHLL
jgi:mannose-1-phosphate guanylyltransferase